MHLHNTSGLHSLFPVSISIFMLKCMSYVCVCVWYARERVCGVKKLFYMSFYCVEVRFYYYYVCVCVFTQKNAPHNSWERKNNGFEKKSKITQEWKTEKSLYAICKEIVHSASS